MNSNKKNQSILSRMRQGLARTRDNFIRKLDDLFSRSGKIDDEFYDELESILIQADVGIQTTLDLVDEVKELVESKKEAIEAEDLKKLLKENLSARISKASYAVKSMSEKPHVIMVVGVNGTGKTATIGKLAWRYKNEGKKVVMAASDTFRAAAAEQLTEWANRSGVDIIKHQEGADPAAVAYDGLQGAISRKADVLIVDTAGRLHTKVNLMKELEKIKRVLDREVPGAPHEVLLVVDATTGQNALSQAKTFRSAVDVTGIVLTKLDGTAKGGIVIRIIDELNIPVKLVGVGEGIDDLKDFSPERFIEALFES